MIFEQLIYTDLGCASYLIGCQGTAEAIVVDPALDTRPLERALAHHHGHAMPPHTVAHVCLAHGARHGCEFGGAL